MSNRVEYSSPVAPSATPSGSIWGQMPMEDIILHGRGYHYFNDFIDTPTFSGTTAQVGIKPFLDTGTTLQGIPTEVGGVLQASCADGTDEDQVSFQVGDTTAAYAKISSTAGKKLAFEYRVRIDSAAIADHNFFVGLVEEGSSADSFMTDATGALADKDLIGFRTLAASPSELDTVYKKAGQTIVEVDDNVTTLALATWYKLGLVFDPTDSAKALKYYVDGVEVASAPATVLDDATFPDGEEMALLFCVKATAAAVKTMSIDWVKFAQVR